MLTDKRHGVVQLIDLGMCLRVPFVADRSSSSTSSSSDDGETSLPIYLTPQQCRGKRSYVAPEVLREKSMDPFAADIWSLGVCLYGMLTGHPLYSGPEDLAFQVMEKGGVEDVIACYERHGLLVPECARSLLCHLLHSDPTQRLTLEQIMAHPFLDEAHNVPAAVETCGDSSSAIYRFRHLLRLQ